MNTIARVAAGISIKRLNLVGVVIQGYVDESKLPGVIAIVALMILHEER